jgi:DGQHR domain-containing protein
MIFVSKKLNKWQKFEMRVREFLRGIFLEDTIDPDDFGFAKYGGYQLDACGGLEGHLVLIDCTTANDPGARSLRDKIKDFHNKQPDFQRDIAGRFGKKYPSIHYVICPQDIDVSDSDLKYAEDRGIRIIPSDNLTEWMKLVSIGSPTLAYQFIEYFAKEKIPIPSGTAYRFPAIRLPLSAAGDGRSLYAFTASPDQLLRLGFVYRLEYKDVKGYQRPLKLGKLRDINRFLSEDEHNGFPTSVLVAFDEQEGRRLEFSPIGGTNPGDEDSAVGELVVPAYYGIAEVIDGQHRLFGYHDFTRTRAYESRLSDRRKHDRLLVVAYPDPQQTERPKLFLDINSNQTKIPTRQIWAMMGRSRADTQMGFIANIVQKLNEKGPLRDQIQVPGYTRGTRPLNIANVGSGIENRHLVDNAADFDWNLYEGVRGLSKYPAEPSVAIVQSFQDLFAAARESAYADWTSGGRSFLLSNNGANVLLRVYSEILKYYRHDTRRVQIGKSRIKRLLSPTLSKFVRENTPRTLLRRTSNESGREEVAAELMARIKRRVPEFAVGYLSQRQKRLRKGRPAS